MRATTTPAVTAMVERRLCCVSGGGGGNVLIFVPVNRAGRRGQTGEARRQTWRLDRHAHRHRREARQRTSTNAASTPMRRGRRQRPLISAGLGHGRGQEIGGSSLASHTVVVAVELGVPSRLAGVDRRCASGTHGVAVGVADRGRSGGRCRRWRHRQHVVRDAGREAEQDRDGEPHGSTVDVHGEGFLISGLHIAQRPASTAASGNHHNTGFPLFVQPGSVAP